MAATDLIFQAYNTTITTLNMEPGSEIIGHLSIREVISFFLILIIAFILGKLLANYVYKKYSHKMRKDQLSILLVVLRILIFVVGLMIAAPNIFEISMQFLLILIGIIALAIALSSTKIISDFVAGLAIFYEHPVRVGNYIEIGEVSGIVEEIRLLSTVLRTDHGVYVRVPNDMIYTTKVNNFHANVARRFDYSVGIRYEDDTREAIQVIEDLFESIPQILHNPAPMVFVAEYAPSSVVIKFFFWVPSTWANTSDTLSFKTRILRDVKTALYQRGIQIAYPQEVIWFGNPDISPDKAGKPGKS